MDRYTTSSGVASRTSGKIDMQRLLVFLTTSFIVRFFVWIPLRFIFLRIFGLYVGKLFINIVGGILLLYFLERIFVLFQADDGRGLFGVFIPKWLERRVSNLFWKITRPLRRQYFIFKYGYPPK